MADGADRHENARWLDQMLIATDLTVLSAHRWRCRADWKVTRRCLGDSMIFLMLEGLCQATVDGVPGTLTVPTGSVLVIPEGRHHAVWPVGGGVELVTVHFLARLYGTVGLLATLGLAGVVPLDSFLVQSTAAMAREYNTAPPGHHAVLVSQLSLLLTALIRQKSLTRRIGNLFGPNRHGDAADLLGVFEYIEHHLNRTDLKVADLAETFGASEVTLRKRFTMQLGCSPVAFIRQRRVARACAMLRAGREPLKAIAAACGFATVGFFHRVFGQLMGMTPAAYRQMVRSVP